MTEKLLDPPGAVEMQWCPQWDDSNSFMDVGKEQTISIWKENPTEVTIWVSKNGKQWTPWKQEEAAA